MLVWIWIMHEGRSGDGHVGTDWCLHQRREIFFTLYFILYSAAVCVTEHLHHSVIAGNSKDPSVENCFFWASFNARNLCCPWAINNSWRSVLQEYYNMHVCTRLHLWAYMFAWMCDSVFSNVRFSIGKWRNTFLIYSLEAFCQLLYTHIFLNRLWTDSVLQHYMFLELFRQ